MTPAPADKPAPLPWSRLGWALLAGVLVRTLVLLVLHRAGYVYPDEESYLDIGANILKGQGYVMSMTQFEGLIRPGEPTTYWGCLTPLLSAGLQSFLGSSLLGIRLTVGTLSLVATLLLTLHYARHFLDRSELTTLGWLIALYPNLHFLGSFLMTEALFIPLTMASLLLVRRATESGRFRDGIFAGFVFGLAHLTRPVLMPFEIAILGLVWWRKKRSARWLLQSCLCLVATALVLSPWIARNQRHYGSLVVETKSGFGLFLQNNADRHEWLRTGALASTNIAVRMPDMSGSNEFIRSRLCGERFLEFVKQSPGLYLDLCRWRARDLFELNPRWMTVPQVASPVVGVLMLGYYLVALAGLIVALRRRILPEAILLLAYISILSIATIAAPRYRAPADPVLLMLASVGLIALVRRWRPAPPGEAPGTPGAPR